MKVANLISLLGLLATSAVATPGTDDVYTGALVPRGNGGFHWGSHDNGFGYGHDDDYGKGKNGGKHDYNDHNDHHSGKDGSGKYDDHDYYNSGNGWNGGDYGGKGDGGQGSYGGALKQWSRKTCSGGQFYSGWKGSCACPKGYEYRNGKCAGHPKKSKPRHGGGQSCYCAKSVSNYRLFKDDDDYCDDEDTQIFCCDKRDFFEKVKEYCPPHPTCSGTQKYSYSKKGCVCSGGMQPYGGTCVFPPISPKNCAGGQKCFCAKDPDNYTKYDRSHAYCADDGYNFVFCCDDKPGEPEKYCRDKWYS